MVQREYSFKLSYFSAQSAGTSTNGTDENVVADEILALLPTFLITTPPATADSTTAAADGVYPR
jgi:hypothetical protein